MMIKKRLTIQKAILVLITLMVLIIPLTANADDGDIVQWDGEMSWIPEILLSDNNGGAIVVELSDGPYINPDQVRAQRYDHNGNELWGPNGAEVSHLLNPTYPNANYPAAIEDMWGGIIVAYAAINSIYAQRLDANGNKLWDEGIAVLSGVNPLKSPIITPDGLGGAYIGYGRKINHIKYDGTVIDSNGYEYVPSAGVDEFSMIYDGQRTLSQRIKPGGVFLAWYSSSTEKIHAQHFKNSLLWGDTSTMEGVIVSTAYTYIGVASDEPTLRVMRDGNGGLIVAWFGQWSGIGQVRTQRLNADGGREWGDDGVAVVDSSIVGGTTNWKYYLKSPDLATDSSGGVILAWNDMRSTTGDNPGDFDVYCQRVNADGSVHWKTNGIRVTWDPIDFANPRTEISPAMVSDGNGGVVIAVQYSDLSHNIFVNRIDGEGVTIWTEWMELSDDYFYNEAQEDQNSPRIIFDGTGPDPKGAIVAWLGHELGWDGYAKKIEISDSRPGNDNIADAYTLNIPGSSGLGSVYRATNDGSSSCGTNGQPDVWYKYTAPYYGVLNFNTCRTHDLYDIDVGLDTVLSLHSGIPGTTGNELVCSDNSFREGCAESGFNTDSFLTRSLNSGETIYIRVARYDSTTNGQFHFSWSFEPIIDACEGDFEPDGDVDGSDLAVFDVDGSDLAVFASDFGRTDCTAP